MRFMDTRPATAIKGIRSSSITVRIAERHNPGALSCAQTHVNARAPAENKEKLAKKKG